MRGSKCCMWQHSGLQVLLSDACLKQPQLPTQQPRKIVPSVMFPGSKSNEVMLSGAGCRHIGTAGSSLLLRFVLYIFSSSMFSHKQQRICSSSCRTFSGLESVSVVTAAGKCDNNCLRFPPLTRVGSRDQHAVHMEA